MHLSTLSPPISTGSGLLPSLHIVPSFLEKKDSLREGNQVYCISTTPITLPSVCLIQSPQNYFSRKYPPPGFAEVSDEIRPSPNHDQLHTHFASTPNNSQQFIHSGIHHAK